MDQRLDGWDVSLDAPLKEDSDSGRIDFISSEEETIEDSVARKEMEGILNHKIEEFKQNMTDRELDIFDQRIFSDSPVTLQEIGDKYDISRERVRQIEKNILKKMKAYFKDEIPDFDSFLMDIPNNDKKRNKECCFMALDCFVACFAASRVFRS